MAGAQGDDAEKTHEPTQHKLDEARKKGELARSADLNTAGSYGGFLLAALAAGAGSIRDVSSGLMGFLDHPEHFARQVFAVDGGGGAAALGGAMSALALGRRPNRA